MHVCIQLFRQKLSHKRKSARDNADFSNMGIVIVWCSLIEVNCISGRKPIVTRVCDVYFCRDEIPLDSIKTFCMASLPLGLDHRHCASRL